MTCIHTARIQLEKKIVRLEMAAKTFLSYQKINDDLFLLT